MGKPPSMRTNLTLSLLSSTLFANLLSMQAGAQINNAGFEDLNSSSLPQYWSADIHLLAITVDSNGVWHVDSVVYDGGTDYALSADAHSGQYAMELRNGYNFTQQGPLVGRVHASTDTATYQGFPLISVPVAQRPESIGFWAKYAPLADDSAEVSVNVLDVSENIIGTGYLTIGGAVPQYTAFNVSITYTSLDAAAFIQLTFANATYLGTASLGTRLLIDDVSVAFEPDAVGEHTAPALHLSLFPVPSDMQCTVRSSDGARVLDVTVLAADGRAVAAPVLMGDVFDTSALPVGNYLLSVLTNVGVSKARMVVVH